MKEGKMLRITDDRTIYIIANEDGSYISPEGEIRYRNVGANYEHKFIQEAFVSVERGMVNVLDAVGKEKFHFPEIWLNTDAMKIQSLIGSGLLQINE